MKIQQQTFHSIEQAKQQFFSNKTESSFAEILAKQQIDTELKFSKHAIERLKSRNIDLTEAQYERLQKGVQKAEEKGIQDSLVLIDKMAFIVNVKHHTVITAVDQSKDKIFSKIDGAIVI